MVNMLILCLSMVIGVVAGHISTNTYDECTNPFYKVGEQCIHFGNFDFLELKKMYQVKY